MYIDYTVKIWCLQKMCPHRTLALVGSSKGNFHMYKYVKTKNGLSMLLTSPNKQNTFYIKALFQELYYSNNT